MEEIFDEVLALCLDRVADGDDPATCAADFPEFPELLALLEPAAQLSSLPRPEPDPTWLARSRDRVAARLAQRRTGQRTRPPTE